MAAYTPKTRPFAHQIEYLRKSAGRSSFAAFMEMGTGKTKCLIDDFCRAHAGGLINRVLVFANKGAYANWVHYEIPAHMPDEVPRAVYLWTGSESQEHVRMREQVLRTDTPHVLQVLVMNIEGMGASERARSLAKRFVTGGRTMIVVDESTTIKNHEAIRTKFVAQLGQHAVMRRIATGSPVTRDPLDLWGQFMFLGEGLLQQRTYWSFRARYAVLQEKRIGRRTIQVPVAFRYLDELEQIVSQHSHRVLKEACLDLPEKVYVWREVEMTDAQRRMYEEMRRRSITMLQEGGEEVMSATIAMTQIMRMQQILCGHFRDDDTGTITAIPNNRVQALLDLAEESPDASTIVWCAYRADVAAVAAALCDAHGPGSVVEYHGGTSPADRSAAVAAFQEGRARFFVSTQATGGRGITLTRATLVVYYSNDHDLEHRIQSEDRAHRIGQTRHVTYADLVVRGTVDERITAALRKKIDIASLVMGDGAREWLQ